MVKNDSLGREHKQTTERRNRIVGKIEKRDCKSNRRVETDRFTIPFGADYAVVDDVCKTV